MASNPPPGAYILGGGLISLGILRSLGPRRIPITLFEFDGNDIACQSRYARVVRLSDPDDGARVIDQVLECAAREAAPPALFVSGDRFLLHACRNLHRLQQHLRLVLPPPEAAETVVSKQRFQAFAQASGVPVPRGWIPASEQDLQASVAALRFPVILKPVRSTDWQDAALVAAQGHIKMIRADSAAELIAHWRRLAAHGLHTLVQDYIGGGDSDHYSYLSYRDRAGRELAGACLRKLRLNPIHGGLATLVDCVEDEWMRAAARQVLEQLGYAGAASVCFKRDPESGQACIFEINGRLPLAHAALQANGLDLPFLMYRDALGLPCAPQPPAAGTARWLSLSHDIWAVRDYFRCGELRVADWLRSLGRVRHVVEFDPRDPGPFLWFTGLLLRLGAATVRKRVRAWFGRA